MAVAKAQASLQVLWRFIAIVRGCNWHDWFYCECFGAFTIVDGCGPVAHCGEGLVVALHGIHGQLPLWQEAHCCLAQCTRPMPLWQGACCYPPWQMWPNWRACHTCLWQRPHCLWHTHCTCLWWRTCLWQPTRHLQCTCHAQPWRICAADCCITQYGCPCILQSTTWKFNCCMGVFSIFPCLHLLLSLLLAIWHKEMIAALPAFSSWRCNQSYCWRFAPLWLSIWFIHINENGWLSLCDLALLLQSTVIVAPCNTT